MSFIWGIDLGGTKIEGIVLRSLNPLDVVVRQRVDTQGERGYQAVLQQVQSLIQILTVKAGCSPAAIGFGTPGVLDPETHLLKNSNTTCMNGKPLREDLARILGVPIVMQNDANCFALAENRGGASQGAECSFGVIMGTGVGGGVTFGGRARYGCNGIGGEWGHNALEPDGYECYCGKRGCVEQVISGPALEKWYEEKAGTVQKMSNIVTRAENGSDPIAIATIDRLVVQFGKALSTVINILDPEVIVLGGGLSNIPALYDRGVGEVRKNVFTDKLHTKIVKNALGDSAGVYGAAFLVG